MIPAAQLPDWCGHSGNARWPYVVKRQLRLTTGIECDWDVEILSWGGKPLGCLQADGTLIVLDGYHFDGATSAPDFPEVMRAACGHDILCQATKHREFPLDRHEADRLFLRWAKEDKFALAWAYYTGLRLFGTLHGRVNKVKPDERVTLVFHDAD